MAELLLSFSSRPPFGPVVTVGSGGVAAELLGDVVQRLAPVDDGEARGMLRSLRLYKLLDGYRGGTPADVEAAVRAVVALSEMAVAQAGQIEELEINPLVLRAAGQGAVAVDGLARRVARA